jgi:hypothetical protein
VRCLEDYPLRSQDRARPERYLTILFAVGVFKEQQFGKLWVPEEDLESEAEFQARRFAAVREIQSWKLAEKMSRIAPNSSIFYSQILRIIREGLDAMKNLSICQAQNREQVRRRNVQLR